MRKRIAWLLMIVMIFGIMTTGCGGKKADDHHYVFATWAAGTELKEFQAIIDKVNEEAAGEYSIEVLSIPSDYYVKMSSLIAAKKSPDFFWLTQELVSKYADMGAIANLTEQFEQSETLTPDRFYEGVLASATYQDSYWGLPWIANPMIVYYNKTMLNELGITAPTSTDDWTWSDFTELCRAVSGQTYLGNDVFGTVIDGWPNIETFIWAGGGDIIAEDGSTILLDQEGASKGLAYLQTFVSEKLTPRYADVASLGDNNVWFEKQRVAFYFGGIQDDFEQTVAALDESEQFEIGYAPMPVCDDGRASSFDWTASTVMAASRQDDPIAYKAMEAVTQAIFDWKIAAPVTDSIENVTMLYPEKQNAMDTIRYTMDNARSAYYIPEWSDINDKLWYNLYVQMLNDPEFDYHAELLEIQQYSDSLIDER